MQQTNIYPEFRRGEATTGGRSVVIVTGGSAGDVLTQQADGTFLPVTPEAGGLENASDVSGGVLVDNGDGSTLGTIIAGTIKSEGSGVGLFLNSGNGGVWLRYNMANRLLMGGSGVGLYASIYGSAANSYDCGTPTSTLRSGYFATSVVTPTITNGASPVSFSSALSLSAITKTALLATTPSASAGIWRISDDSNKPAYSDGSAWRYLTDGTEVV